MNSSTEDNTLTPILSFRDKQLEDTRQRLWAALDRLRSGNTNIVPIGTKLSAKALAEEACVDRATLYRSHSIVLEEVRCSLKEITPKAPRPAPKVRRTDASKVSEYRTLAEQAQQQVTMLARQLYMLDAQISELTRTIEMKNSIIKELTERVEHQIRIVK